MGKLLHALVAMVAALSGAHLTNPHALTNDQQYAAGLATYGGVTAWWGETGTRGIAHLMVRTRHGKVMALPPTLSEEAETVDVGRGPDGAVWITYARCHGSSASCQAYAYNMTTRRERPLHLGQTVAVAVDGNEVAWFREPRQWGTSQLLVGSLTAPGGVAHRVRLDRIDGEPVGTPLALELRDGRLAYAANEGGDDIRTAVLRAGTPGAMQTISEDGFYGEGCTRVEVAPTLTPGALTWMENMSGRSCRPASNKLVRYALPGGAETRLELSVPAAKEAVMVDDGHVLTLAPRDTSDTDSVRDACIPSDPSDDEGAGFVGCEVRVVRAPGWLPGRGS
jgi:hypothetical protein